MVCLIAVKDCPRTQLQLEARFASEGTQPWSGGGGRSARYCGHRTGRGVVIHMVGEAGGVLAGGFVRKEAERLLSCECSSRLGSTASLPRPLPAGDSLGAHQQFRFGLRSGLMWAQRIP